MDEKYKHTKEEFNRALHRLATLALGALRPTIPVNDVVSLVAQLQLALRHPRNRGPSSIVARAFVDQTIAQLAALEPIVGEVLRMGDDPAHEQLTGLADAGTAWSPNEGAACKVCSDIMGGEVRHLAPCDGSPATAFKKLLDGANEAREQQLVPGLWECAKCGFALSRQTISPAGIRVTVADATEPDLCPNDGTLMERVTWKQYATKVEQAADRQLQRAVKAEELVKELQLKATLRASFDELEAGDEA